MERHDRGPADWRAGRRLRAWALKATGWSQQAIAEAQGGTAGAVSQWMRRGRAGGGEALKRRIAPGPRPQLPDEQRAHVPVVLAPGAEAFGFRGAVWTAPRVATGMRRECGVRSQPHHVGKLPRALGWSVQTPIERASPRNEAALAAWRTARWPALKKGLTRRVGPSSGAMNRASPCSPAPSAPPRRVVRRPSSACH